jgi:hypothetical protein
VNYLKTIAELEEVAGRLGIKLRYEKGDFDGGYCILKEQQVLVVNKRLHDARKAAVLAQALMFIGIEGVFVKPALRQFIEDEVAKERRQHAMNS